MQAVTGPVQTCLHWLLLIRIITGNYPVGVLHNSCKNAFISTDNYTCNFKQSVATRALEESNYRQALGDYGVVLFNRTVNFGCLDGYSGWNTSYVCDL